MITLGSDLDFPFFKIKSIEVGTFYNYYRDYNPSTGRYVESDPIGLRGGMNTYGYVYGSPVLFNDALGLKPWDFNGLGDTGVCAYYDRMYSQTQCNYYKVGGQICRGQREDVNQIINMGLRFSWATGRSTLSQAQTLTSIRNSLVNYDKISRSLNNISGCDCNKGDYIDIYHELAFKDAGISPSFYGGNLWPQGVKPNPVPYDPRGNSKYDPRRLFNK